MISFVVGLPAWLLSHLWLAGAIVTMALALMACAILLNPGDRQLRSYFRCR